MNYLTLKKRLTLLYVMHWDKGLLEASGEIGIRNLGFGYPQDRLRLVEQDFSSFFVKFLPYLMIFKQEF